MNEQRWFSVPIWYDYVEIDDQQLNNIIDFCFKLSNYDQGRVKSNIGGWQSQDIHYDTFHQLNGLLEIFKLKISVLSKITDTRLALNNCWININYKDNYNINHIHPNCVYSGVFYLSASQDQGDIIFKNPNPFSHFVVPFIDDENLIHYKPETKKILMFPSWLEHRVEPNLTDSPRISIAFNVQLT